MTRFVDQELATAGAASVIVVLTDEAKAIPETQAAADSLEPYFTAEGSQLAAVALAEDLPVETMRYYPNLGVAYGSVDRDGYAALRSDPAVDQVVGAPQLSLTARYTRPPRALQRERGALTTSAFPSCGRTGSPVRASSLPTWTPVSTLTTRRLPARSAVSPSSTRWDG